jgi:hypothetical protein
MVHRRATFETVTTFVDTRLIASRLVVEGGSMRPLAPRRKHFLEQIVPGSFFKHAQTSIKVKLGSSWRSVRRWFRRSHQCIDDVLYPLTIESKHAHRGHDSAAGELARIGQKLY